MSEASDEAPKAQPAKTKAELIVQQEKGYIVPRTIEEAHRFAQAVFSAGVVPPSYRSQQEVLIGILKAMEVGLPPLTGLSWIMIVNNRPTIWGDGALALIHQSGQLVSHDIRKIGTPPVKPESLMSWPDDYGYEATLVRKGYSKPFVGRFTVGDARRAKLWLNPKKDPWHQYPDRMLMIRARAFPIRDGFADCLAGLSIYEEVIDTDGEASGRATVDAGELFADTSDNSLPPATAPDVKDKE